jgi:hypothetical protein
MTPRSLLNCPLMALALGVGIGAVLALTGCGDDDAWTTGPRSTLPQPQIVRRLDHPSPNLTSADRKLAERIVATDSALRLILGGDRYRIKNIGEFTLANSSRLIGAAVVLELEEPLNGEVSLPVACFPKHGNYISQVYPWEFHDATRLMILVDFRVGQVVDVDFSHGSPAGPIPAEPRACAKADAEED